MSQVSVGDECCKYRPEGGNVLVKQKRIIDYYPEGRTLVGLLEVTVDIFFSEVEWVPVAQWFNNTRSPISYKQLLKTGLNIPHPVQVVEAIQLPDIFNNLSITFDDHFKCFRKEETVAPSTTTIDVTVEPETRLFLYQKRWKFGNDIWFTCGSQPISFNTHNNTTPKSIYVEAYIDGCEYMLTSELLRNSKQVRVEEFDRVHTLPDSKPVFTRLSFETRINGHRLPLQTK